MIEGVVIGTFWHSNDSRGELEVPTGTLIIVEVSLRYLLVP